MKKNYHLSVLTGDFFYKDIYIKVRIFKLIRLNTLLKNYKKLKY